MDENAYSVYEVPMGCIQNASAGYENYGNDVRYATAGSRSTRDGNGLRKEDGSQKSTTKWPIAFFILCWIIYLASAIALFVLYSQSPYTSNDITLTEETAENVATNTSINDLKIQLLKDDFVQERIRLNHSEIEREQRLLTLFNKATVSSSEMLHSIHNLESLFSKLNGWQLTKRNLAYKKFSVTVDYSTAEIECSNHGGGRLVSKALRDPSAVSHMISMGYTSSSFWIGFTDKRQEGTWIWADGGNMNSETTAWFPGEPNSSEGRDEDCGEVRAKLGGVVLLNDASCSTKLHYVCEIEL